MQRDSVDGVSFLFWIFLKFLDQSQLKPSTRVCQATQDFCSLSHVCKKNTCEKSQAFLHFSCFSLLATVQVMQKTGQTGKAEMWQTAARVLLPIAQLISLHLFEVCTCQIIPFEKSLLKQALSRISIPPLDTYFLFVFPFIFVCVWVVVVFLFYVSVFILSFSQYLGVFVMDQLTIQRR